MISIRSVAAGISDAAIKAVVERDMKIWAWIRSMKMKAVATSRIPPPSIVQNSV